MWSPAPTPGRTSAFVAGRTRGLPSRPVTATITAATERLTGAPVLTVVQNDPTVPLDRFGAWLDGVDVRVVRAWQEDVPGADEAGAGVLVLGGPMSVRSAEHPWLADVRRLLLGAVATDVPVLGICLGHQLLAQALGGRVHVDAPPALAALDG